MPPKVNKILGFYTADGRKVTADQDYSYAQIELLGSHARDVKKKYSKRASKKVSKEIFDTSEDDQGKKEPEADGYIMLVSKPDLNLVMNYGERHTLYIAF